MPENVPKSDSREHYPVLELVLNSIADWVNNHRASSGSDGGLSRCDREEIMQIASDLGVSADELRELSSKGPGSADLAKKMLVALGVDPQALIVKDPLVMRDIQRLCTTCRDKARCMHELADGTAAAHFHEFCPNAFTLDALLAGNAEAAKKDQTATH
ncbi:MAG: DUF6455 family protein [Pseudolabrys sp.]|nr:DUF6455 family protein [Pseudolabrys sp.]MDP2299028.1 DUF6455 family protein [Pseudolabrys sp.]